MKLRINPLVASDLKTIRDYIAEDNAEVVRKTVDEIYKSFENLQQFPTMGTDLSKRVSFKTDYKYLVHGNYITIYLIKKSSFKDLEFEGGIKRMTGIKRIQIDEEWADSTIIEAGNFVFVGYCMKNESKSIEEQIDAIAYKG